LYLVPGTYYLVPGNCAATGYQYKGLQVGPTKLLGPNCCPG